MSKKINLFSFLGIIIIVLPLICAAVTGTSVQSYSSLIITTLIIGSIILIGSLIYYFIYEKDKNT